jgi:predicted transposase YbfD/YdcC
VRAKEAPDHIKEAWPGSAWIVELITTTIKRKRKGKGSVRRHLFITTVRTTPEALLRLIRQRWSIENEGHWARDTQLGEDVHRYANRTGAPVFSFLRTVVMILLRRGGYRSIRCGLRALAHDIKGMLALGGIQLAKNDT